jgi:hypothetical protein
MPDLLGLCKTVSGSCPLKNPFFGRQELVLAGPKNQVNVLFQCLTLRSIYGLMDSKNCMLKTPGKNSSVLNQKMLTLLGAVAPAAWGIPHLR